MSILIDQTKRVLVQGLTGREGRARAKLMKEYGPLLTGNALRKVLGYPSLAAMRQAVFQGTFPVKIFTIEHRRGKFAFVEDVAYWLAEQRLRTGVIHSNITDEIEGGDDS